MAVEGGEKGMGENEPRRVLYTSPPEEKHDVTGEEVDSGGQLDLSGRSPAILGQLVIWRAPYSRHPGEVNRYDLASWVHRLHSRCTPISVCP